LFCVLQWDGRRSRSVFMSLWSIQYAICPWEHLFSSPAHLKIAEHEHSCPTGQEGSSFSRQLSLLRRDWRLPLGDLLPCLMLSAIPYLLSSFSLGLDLRDPSFLNVRSPPYAPSLHTGDENVIARERPWSLPAFPRHFNSFRL
jgi:hypothetical protein